MMIGQSGIAAGLRLSGRESFLALQKRSRHPRASRLGLIKWLVQSCTVRYLFVLSSRRKCVEQLMQGSKLRTRCSQRSVASSSERPASCGANSRRSDSIVAWFWLVGGTMRAEVIVPSA